jgi:hypothetical protein
MHKLYLIFVLLLAIALAGCGGGAAITGVNVISIPSGASITLDGSNTGQVTPHTFTGVTPGLHTVLLHHSGYDDWQDTVTVTNGSIATVNALLSETPPPPP